MGRKNRARQKVDPNKGQEFQVNPFAQLGDLIPKEELPKAEPPKPKPKPKPKAEPKPTLDREDQELLKAFGGDGQVLRFDAKGAAKGPMLSFGIQRKGKGGKTVTHIHGLADLGMMERMELARDLGRALGTNARFNEDVLEVQGDQRARAIEWFAGRGYRTRSV
jgi:translation initiation factor 1 (eIF-1/SUI1)